MFNAIARVMAFFYELPVVGGSYGIAIILLTGAVMTLLMPLTLKATRSTIKMQEMQPKLKELQKEYKDDKQTLNTELMALYQANGINPVGGCLPMVAQLPVFLVLFNVLRGLSRRVSESPFYSIAEQARSQVGGATVEGATFNPRYISQNSEMYADLSRETEMNFGPFDLAQQARDVIQNDVVAGLPYIVLIAFVVATSFYQQRQVSSRRSGSVGMNPQQEMILKVLPLASGVWSFLFPAGLVLYWATSNVFRIGQQSYITRAFYANKESEQAGDAAAIGESASEANDDTADDDDPDDESGDADDETDGDRRASGSTSSKAGGATNSGSKNNGSKGSGAKGGPRKPRKAASAGSATGSAGKSDSSNGDSATNGSGTEVDREEAWARRRDRAKAKSAAKNSANDQSSRVTPKGTKPASSKRKRKR